MTARDGRLNPFPGLRPFEADEDHLFFGREREIDELLRRLRTTRFLSVVGTSGSGKSSLIRSGLIPALYSGSMVKAGSGWRIATLRPGEDPIRHLAAALSPPGMLATADPELAATQPILLEALGEYAVSPRVPVFAAMPVRWIQPKDFINGTGSFPNQSGIGDIRAGAKFSAFTNEMTDVTLLLRGSLPSGDSQKGLGTAHGSIEPAVLVRHDVTDRVSVESQFGLWLPTGGARGIGTGDEKFSGKVLYYGIGPSFDLVTSDRVRFSPVIELVGWRVLGGFETIGFAPADGTNIVNLKIGARATMRRGSLYGGIGWGLTDAVWYDKLFRLEYRVGF